MIVNTIALASILAVLDCASASALKKRQVLKDENIANRLQNATATIGDQCHPPGTYALGGDAVIPPCLSELAVSLKCEIVTQVINGSTSEENWKAYRSCTSGDGSSYFQDAKACLDCKLGNGYVSKAQFDWLTQRWDEGTKVFMDDAVPKATTWAYVQNAIDATECKKTNTSETIRGWNCWNQLPAATGIATKNVTIEEYYKNRPKTQNIGSFTLNGKQYPESSSSSDVVQTEAFEITSKIGHFSSVKIIKDGKLTEEHNVDRESVVLKEYRQIKNIYNFTTPDVFTVLPIISAPVPVKDSVATVPQEEADKLPLAECDQACRNDAPTVEKIQEVAAQSPKEAGNAVAQAALPAMEDLGNNKTISHKSKKTIIAIISEEMSEEKIVAPPSFKDEISLPKNSSEPSIQNAAGSSSQGISAPSSQDDSCAMDIQIPAAASSASVAGSNSSQKALDSDGSTVKVTVCKMPGEKDCKTFFY